MPLVVVGVLVPLGIARLLHQPRRGVAQVERHGTVRRVVFDHREGLVDGHVGRVALGRGGQIDGRFGQRDAGLGHADLMHRVEAGVGQQQGVGIGQPDIFGGEDHQPPGDEARLLTAGQHPRQVVDGGVGVAAPDGLDEGRDDVVVLLAVLVVEGDVLLEAVLHVLVGDRHLAVGGPHHDVENVEQLAGIAPREAEQRRGLLHLDLSFAQFGVLGQCAVEQFLQVGILQRLEDVDLTAAQQRGDYLERGVFRSGADQRDDPLLDGPEQRILLRLVEAVDLVDEEERGLLVEEPLLAGRLDHLADLLDARRDGRKGEERTVELRGDDPRQRGLPDSGRPPENERGDVSRLEEFAENALRTHEMFLPDVLIEGLRAQAFG